MRFVLAAVLALALTGCGSDDGNDAASTQPVTVTETVTQTETVTEEPEVTCSTAGLRLTLPEQELPAEVADVRKRVFDAAVACDYDTLEQIALEKGAGFTFSYGGDSDASEYWRKMEEGELGDPRPEADARTRHDPDHALHPERVRLLRVADRVQREPDRRGVAGARRRGPLHAGTDRPR